MSIIPYASLSEHTSPAESGRLALLPSPPAQELGADAIASDAEGSGPAEDRQLDLLNLLILLDLRGAAGELRLGTGSREDVSFIADTMAAEDVRECDGRITVVATTSGGNLSLVLEVESSAQAAA
ncbi:hypothetical protein ACFC26_17115 [Kitasatospora purpeofusca]|uniref:hypothetical protein n=1 Tax=Kitasatospora purpeofusca TaxID=67352 RepID=UPI0035DA4A32